MYTSNPERKGRSALKTAWRYLLAALLCAAFGAGYERFSHGVYSYYMIYAFALPLAAGTLPALFLALRRQGQLPRPAAALWGAGVATLTVGCIFRGALEIYGTTSPLTVGYWIAGGALLVFALLAGVLAGKKTAALPKGTGHEPVGSL